MTVARAFRRSGFVIILLSAALSGCGSDDDSGSSASTTTSSVSRGASENETTLGAWAAGLCQGIASWKQTVKTTSAELDKSQADFASASQAISSTNQALIASLEGLGTPPAPATTDAKQVIDELSTNLKDDAGEIQQTLNGTFSTQAQIASASTKVRSSVSKMNADISNAVTELKALPEQEGWKKSFQRAPACQIVAKG